MPSTQASQRGRVLRVFVVEDSPLVIERIEAMLASIAGARAIGHSDRADEAIRAILRERPDVVMLDWQLAQGSGLDVLRVLNEAAPTTDVYMLSNFASEPYRRLAERLGARDFFDKSNEFQRVREVLAARAAQHVH